MFAMDTCAHIIDESVCHGAYDPARYRIRYCVLSNSIIQRVLQQVGGRNTTMVLACIRFFRTVIGALTLRMCSTAPPCVMCCSLRYADRPDAWLAQALRTSFTCAI
eukprot:COSAG01_NODE_13346_length_1598_cov_1.246164_1_plen_105_part_10